MSRLYGSVPHELWYRLINHTNAEPLIVSGVFFIYFFIVFRVSEFNLQVWECVFFLSFVVVLNLSRNLSILQFFRPEWLLNIIFQFTFFAGLSARRLWIDNSDVYFGLWCRLWHWDTSFWLFTVFPYHCLSTNAWYFQREILGIKSVFKLKTLLISTFTCENCLLFYVYM